MHKGTIFENDQTQAVKLPVEAQFPADVKKVYVRKVGKDRILSPVDGPWDSFFLDGPKVSEDFMPQREPQDQDAREEL